MVEASEPGLRRGPYVKGVRRRRQILDKVMEVYAERGFAKTSLRAIADAVGVSHASVRHQFSSREELLVEILRERDERAQRIEDASTFSALIHSAQGEAKNPGLLALFTSLLGEAIQEDDSVAREFFVEHFRHAREVLLDYISENTGQPRSEFTESLANLILAAQDGLQIQWLLDPTVDFTSSLELLRAFFPDEDVEGAEDAHRDSE